MSKLVVPFAAAERLRRVFGIAQSERLLERAQVAGLLSQDVIARARLEAHATGRSLLEALIEGGAFTEEAWNTLAQDEAREAFIRPSSAASQRLPAEAEAAARDPERVLGDFVLVEQIGRGGTAEVWKAWDRRLARPVAVKISHTAHRSAAERERFEREALAAGRLAHPHILPVYQAGTERGRCFLVMPYVEGGASLEGTSLPLGRALETMRIVALAVEHAHSRGVVHRDLKPGNILIDPAGRVFVADFGLAYLRGEAASRLTGPQDILGTASYMAPEQARISDGSPATAIDVYGLGATLYALVTGRAPFTGDSVAAVMARVLAVRFPLPRSLRPALDPRVEAVVLKAMRKNPRRRHPTAAAFAEELSAILGQPADDRPRPRLSLKGRGLRWGAVVTCVGAALAAVVALVVPRKPAGIAPSHRALEELVPRALGRVLAVRRAGDNLRFQAVLGEIEQAHQTAAAAGPLSPALEARLGRIYRAAFSENDALRRQERALDRDPDLPLALYERAVLLSRRHGRELVRATPVVVMAMGAGQRSSRLASDEAERLRPVLRRLRTDVLATLTRLGGAPLLTPAQRDVVNGLFAYHQGRRDEARASLERAVRADPLSEEAWESLGALELGAGRWEAADAVYTRALARDEHYFPYFAARCEARRHRDADLAKKDAVAALKGEPMNGEARLDARLCHARIRLQLGWERMAAGREPIQHFRAAREETNRSIRKAGTAVALVHRAAAQIAESLFLVRSGRDPSASLAGAEGDLTRALEIEPENVEAWAGRGRVKLLRALASSPQASIGPSLAAAAADLQRALSLHPTHEHSRLWLAEVRAHGAREARGARRDLAEATRAAVALP